MKTVFLAKHKKGKERTNFHLYISTPEAVFFILCDWPHYSFDGDFLSRDFFHNPHCSLLHYKSDFIVQLIFQIMIPFLLKTLALLKWSERPLKSPWNSNFWEVPNALYSIGVTLQKENILIMLNYSAKPWNTFIFIIQKAEYPVSKNYKSYIFQLLLHMFVSH